jgi:hypothetical protein
MIQDKVIAFNLLTYLLTQSIYPSVHFGLLWPGSFGVLRYEHPHLSPYCIFNMKQYQLPTFHILCSKEFNS